MLVGAIAGGGAVVTVVVVAKYKANEQQKAAAAERARAATLALAAHAPLAKHRATAPSEPRQQAAATNPAAAVVEKPQPGQPARPIPTPEEMEEALTHKLPAYLAVPVPKQQIAAEERGEATYMLWDTHRQQLVTDDVYVLKHDVRAGVTVKLNGVKAHVASAQ